MRNIKVILLRCFPRIFLLLPNTILTSPHADTGHECSLIGSYPISPVLIWFKFNSSGNRTGLLWYLIMDYHPAAIRNFDQCIPRCITITCSESTLMCCPMISIELFPNLWTSINFSLSNIINFDQMCQYRPKSSIWKTPTWWEKRSKNYFKQITISNYILLSTFLMTKTKFYILMTSALFFIRK